MRQLEREMPDDRLDARTIARFQVGILQFMEYALGPNSMPPRPFPKLAFSWIDDVRPGGALHDIILKCYQLKETKGMKSLDWRHPQQRMQLVEILENVRSSMAKNQYQVTPTVYFDDSVPKDELESLKAMVLSLKGKVASERNAVGLTHIVYPFGPSGDPDDGEVCHLPAPALCTSAPVDLKTTLVLHANLKAKMCTLNKCVTPCRNTCGRSERERPKPWSTGGTGPIVTTSG